MTHPTRYDVTRLLVKSAHPEHLQTIYRQMPSVRSTIIAVSVFCHAARSQGEFPCSSPNSALLFSVKCRQLQRIAVEIATFQAKTQIPGPTDPVCRPEPLRHTRNTKQHKGTVALRGTVPASAGSLYKKANHHGSAQTEDTD